MNISYIKGVRKKSNFWAKSGTSGPPEVVRAAGPIVLVDRSIKASQTNKNNSK